MEGSWPQPNGAAADAVIRGGEGQMRARLLVVSLVALLCVAVGVGFSPSLATADEGCANEALREQQRSTFLPECRAYEMASPPEKDGGDVMGDPGKTRAALDGSAVQFSSLQAFGGAIGAGVAVDYLAERTGTPGTNGWATHAITPVQDPQSIFQAIAGGIQAPFYVGEFTPNLTEGVFRALSPLTDEPNVATTRNLYLRTDLRTAGAGSYRLVTDSAVPVPSLCFPLCGSNANAIKYKPWIAGASTDLSHIIFESTLELLPGTGTEYTKLYEWVDGTLRLASVLPDGSPAMCDPSNACGIAGTGASHGVQEPGDYTANTISEDGSRVFFTSPVSTQNSGTESSNVYMRDDHGTLDTSDDTTVQLNASEKTPPDPTTSATFQAATPDGSRAFFTSADQLTNTPGAGLYMYDATKPDSDPHNLMLIAPGSQGVLGTSTNGDTVYFLSTAQLVPGQPTLPLETYYIYRWHEGDPLQYVGGFTDSLDVSFNLGQGYSASAPKPSRVSADGRFLVIQARSGDGMTGYQQAQGCSSVGNASPGVAPCSEIYVFDADAKGGQGQMSCASCLPPGAVPGVPASSEFVVGSGASGQSTHLNHPMTEDGHHVFFTTGSPLVPEDRNGTVADVYEYDTLTHAVHLISSGRSSSPSYFLDATPNGSDVFFITRERLVGWDGDESYDLYDARVGGGFPEPPAIPSPCAGDTCQSSSVTPPVSPGLGSALFAGAGNAGSVPEGTSKPLSRAEKLKRALRACKSKRSRAQRRKCESRARRRYGKAGRSK
jgi:hypothetical protein